MQRKRVQASVLLLLPTPMYGVVSAPAMHKFYHDERYIHLGTLKTCTFAEFIRKQAH